MSNKNSIKEHSLRVKINKNKNIIYSYSCKDFDIKLVDADKMLYEIQDTYGNVYNNKQYTLEELPEVINAFGN
jgi:hypothetical protein